MKALKKARADLEKAEAKRDKTKEQLEADEALVKKCQEEVMEAENNEYIGMARSLNVTVEEFAEIIKQLRKEPLASVMATREEKKDETVKVEEKK